MVTGTWLLHGLHLGLVPMARAKRIILRMEVETLLLIPPIYFIWSQEAIQGLHLDGSLVVLPPHAHPDLCPPSLSLPLLIRHGVWTPLGLLSPQRHTGSHRPR